MAVPVISTSNPLSSAVDVFLNVPLYVTFQTPGIANSSVSANSVVLLNVSTQSIVDCNLSYNSTTRILTVTPLSVLAESSVYTLRFPGTDIAISSSYVILESGSNTPLAITLDITFTTGARVYIEDSSVSKDAIDLSLEGDLNLPTNVKALGYFVIDSTSPKNHIADLSGSIDGSNRFYIKFNKALSVADVRQDWLTVNAFPIMDSDQYLAVGTTFGTGTIPAFSGVYATGEYLYGVFYDSLPKNASVQVRVSEDVTAADGSEFGPNSFYLSFTTDRFPRIAGVNIIKTELKATADELNDEYIASLLLKNSIILINRWVAFNPITPQYMAHKYVVNKTIIDILDDKDLEKALINGSRKRLGDLDISMSYRVGELALKHKRAEDEVEEIDDAIDAIKKLGARIEQAIHISHRSDRMWHGVNGRIVDNRFRFSQDDIPAANQAINRHADNGTFYL